MRQAASWPFCPCKLASKVLWSNLAFTIVNEWWALIPVQFIHYALHLCLWGGPVDVFDNTSPLIISVTATCATVDPDTLYR
jgi:hypothetical protein